ncbi:zinc-binding dehydrogenase [Microbacterium sp.]|uniref:alcohol dehydrogenase catalytic domain-containing protein n=1 Tax=Microbacterium sp. TaxID=51671 RepID=UPI0025E878A5|nr:zinc-binding dehydrogenase [Microbacterium sp.]
MSRAAMYDEVGDPRVLYIGQVTDTAPGPGKVAVRVRAAGLNPYDSKVLSGAIASTAPFPRRIGGDLAGSVEAAGEGAVYADGAPVRVGDEVLGRAAGAIAERVIAMASDLAPRPAGLAVEVAGGLHVAGLTAVAILDTVPIGPGDTVLVGGAAGGVGLIAAQLAVAAGARVIGTASARNHELLRSLGVEPVSYGDGLAARVAARARLTAVYDCHGRDALDAGITLGVAAEHMVAIAAGSAGDELGVHVAGQRARTAANLAALAERVASGEIVVPVAATYPLDQVSAAFTAVAGTHAPGKIIVTL